MAQIKDSPSFQDNINSFPGYFISKEGVLYTRWKRGAILGDDYREMKLYTRSNGYKQAVLKIRTQGKLRRVYIHRLVAEVYIPNPNNLPCVCHKDNIRSHNDVNNLYWGTYKDNTQQALKDGRLKGPKHKSLKFIVFSDLHLHNYSKFPSRMETGFKVLNKLISIADEKNVPLLHCGDLLHDPNKIDQDFALRLENEFNRYNDINTRLYTISGNHTIQKVSVIGNKPGSWDSFFSCWYKWIECIDYKRIHIGKYYIYGVPYIDNNIGLSKYLNSIKLVDSKTSKHILLLHTDYPGAKDTDGRIVDSVENINLNALNRFDLILCGHIHKYQRLSKKVYMVGAPYQQRRTDKNCKMGYLEIYSDLSVKFVPLDFPRFIDVESEDEIKDDGNYYTIIPKENPSKVEVIDHKITKQLSKEKLAKRYMKAKGIKDEKKQKLLVKILKEAEQ